MKFREVPSALSYPAAALCLVLGWLGASLVLRSLVAAPLHVVQLWLLPLPACVVGWALGRLVDRLRYDCTRDCLTGLLNRRYFEIRLAEAVAQYERDGRSYAVLLMDVDALKLINDEEGHPAGDHALRLVGEALRAGVRACDVAARLGGDEFVVLLQGDARAAEVLGARVCDLSVSQGGPRLSFGVADFRGDPGAAVSTADMALYRAKRQGRTRRESGAVLALRSA